MKRTPTIYIVLIHDTPSFMPGESREIDDISISSLAGERKVGIYLHDLTPDWRQLKTGARQSRA